MRLFYDLHIHTALSPCGDNDMTPNNIVNMALLGGLQIIAVTDHNTCGNAAAVMEAARGTGLLVLPGMELCTAEEAHVVCLFSTVSDALAFEARVRPTLPAVDNRPAIFGDQLLLDALDEMVGQETVLLTTASGISVDDAAALARAGGGVAFPAHIDRPSYSVTAALGDLPPLGFAAVEITAMGDAEALRARYPEMQGKILLRDSDAHYLEQMAEAGPWLELPEPSAPAVIAALRGELPCSWGI